MKSFVAKTRSRLLSNIIHSYVGTVLVFSAMYYQCSVLGDISDAANKRDLYSYQAFVKKHQNPRLKIILVEDHRAFKGIKPRIWSGIDYPGSNLLYSNIDSLDTWRNYVNNQYDDLTIEQITTIVENIDFKTAKIIEYQPQNKFDVYVDCLYFSVISIATVGFGDISPNLWYTKLFASIEVLIGMSIFVFAIGMLFASWNKENKSIA